MRTQACVTRLAVLFISLVVLVSSPVLAQKITGDISGDIADTSGAVIPNAAVTAKNLGTDLTRTATTTSSGSYRIPDLPVGNYSVSVQAGGFKTMKRQVEVAANAVIHADFKMQVGSREETVTVEGVAPMVDLSSNNNNYVNIV